MLSIGSISSAGGASQYYGISSSSSSYYLESPGQLSWHGDAKAALDLSENTVESKELENVLNGLSAKGEPLTEHAASGKKRQLGIDLTFSAPKSVSILMHGEHGPKLLQLVRAANHSAMSFVQSDLAQTRQSDKDTGKRVYVSGQKIAYLSIEEQTSRANDPGFHIHNVVPNLVLCDDGNFRAMHNTMVFRYQKLAGAVFRAELAKGLKDMGLELEPAGQHGLFEVKSVPAEVRAQFSKRRHQMVKLFGDSQKDKGAMDRIALISRPSKDVMSMEAIKTRWDIELETLGTSFEKISQDAFAPKHSAQLKVRSPEQLLRDVVGDLSDSKRAWTKFEILGEALMKCIPEVTAAELQSEIDRTVKSGALLKEGNLYTTPAILKREAAVMDLWRRGQLRGAVIADSAPSQIMDGFMPTSGQQAAADLVVSSRDRIIGVQGNAGVGKTTLVKLAAPVIKDAGYKLIGIAPTNGAVDELKKDKIFDKVMTTQQYCLTPFGDENSVLIVDESSMLGTKSMENILNYANSRGLAKAILMGDVNQLGSVEAGTPFADLQKAGMQTAHVDEIIRQKDSRHRQAVSQLAKGEIEKGLHSFSPEIHDTEWQAMNGRAAQLWKQTNNPRTPIIVQTNAQKLEINMAIKSALGQSTKGVEHKIWRPIHMNRSERVRADTYEAGTHIRFNRDIKRFKIKRGDIFKIDSVDVARSEILLSSGRKTRHFSPAKYELGDGTVELYDQSFVMLNKDDRIRFTRGGRSRAVNNNDFGFIRKIDSRRAIIELDKGQTLTLPLSAPELRHMDHGWATTCHAYQGKTVENAVVVMPSRANPLTTLASLYTGASRHTHGVAIVTDDRQRLRVSIEQALDTSLALSKAFRPELEQQEPYLAIETATPQPAIGDSLEKPNTGLGCDLSQDSKPQIDHDSETRLPSEADNNPSNSRENKPKLRPRPTHQTYEEDRKAWAEHMDSLDANRANRPQTRPSRDVPDHDIEM